MGPDKLECLLDSFIAYRLGTFETDWDTVDGIPTHPLLNIPAKHYVAQSAAGVVPDCLAQGAEGFVVPCCIAHGAGGFVVPHAQATEEIVDLIPESLNTTQSAQFAHIGRCLADLAHQISISHQNNKNSCVRFEKSCIIVPPEEQSISLTLIRCDTFKDTVTKVTWMTQDKTAVSGNHYVASSGEVVFEKGVMRKAIQIKILKTSNDTMDLRFHVKMSVLDEEFDPKIMTVALNEIRNFRENERQVVESLPSSAPFTVEAIRSILDNSLSCRTFHMALTHLCSAADSVHLEFALALDLSRLCFPKLRRSSVLNVLGDFFRTEDIEEM